MWQRFDWQQFDPRGNPSVHQWYQRVQSKPGWVWKATLGAALIVFVIPVLLLVATAVLAAIVVFTMLSLVLNGIALVRGLFTGPTGGWPSAPADDGRRNVRIRARGPGEPF